MRQFGYRAICIWIVSISLFTAIANAQTADPEKHNKDADKSSSPEAVQAIDSKIQQLLNRTTQDIKTVAEIIETRDWITRERAQTSVERAEYTGYQQAIDQLRQLEPKINGLSRPTRPSTPINDANDEEDPTALNNYHEELRKYIASSGEVVRLANHVEARYSFIENLNPRTFFGGNLGIDLAIGLNEVDRITAYSEREFLETQAESRENSIKHLRTEVPLQIGRLSNFDRIVAKYDEYMQDLHEYEIKLIESEKKLTDRRSMVQNLFLIIGVIGSLSIGVIALIRWFPDDVMAIWVESGQVIQFVTVMILLSVILALGLVEIIKENTLGTLLGGIGGYVLAQGVGRSAANQALKERDQIQQLKEGA